MKRRKLTGSLLWNNAEPSKLPFYFNNYKKISNFKLRSKIRIIVETNGVHISCIVPKVEMSNLVLKEDVKPSAKFEPAGGHTYTRG